MSCFCAWLGTPSLGPAPGRRDQAWKLGDSSSELGGTRMVGREIASAVQCRSSAWSNDCSNGPIVSFRRRTPVTKRTDSEISVLVNGAAQPCPFASQLTVSLRRVRKRPSRLTALGSQLSSLVTSSWRRGQRRAIPAFATTARGSQLTALGSTLNAPNSLLAPTGVAPPRPAPASPPCIGAPRSQTRRSSPPDRRRRQTPRRGDNCTPASLREW